MKYKTLILGIVVMLALFASSAALAAEDAGYDLSWWSVDSSGGISSGVGYSLHGTIGQPDAGPLLTGSGYQLSGGFWGGAFKAPPSYPIFLPLIIR